MIALLVGCRTPDVAPEVVAEPLEPGFTRVEGNWFTVDVPVEWRSAPLESEKRRNLFALRLRSVEPAPDVQVLVSRPRGLPTGTPAGRPDPTLRKALGQALGGRVVTPVEDSSTLVGVEAALFHVRSRTPGGAPVEAATWVAVAQDHLVTISCSATGDGIPVAGEVCPKVAASLRLRDLPPLQPDRDSPLAERRLGPLTVQLPSHWRELEAEPGSLGGYGAPVAERGAVDLYEVTLHLFKNVASLEDLGETLERSGASGRLVAAEDVASGLGPGRLSEYSDGLQHAWVLHTLLPGGGAGIEVACAAPERFRNESAGRCEGIFGSLRVAQPGSAHQ